MPWLRPRKFESCSHRGYSFFFFFFCLVSYALCFSVCFFLFLFFVPCWNLFVVLPTRDVDDIVVYRIVKIALAEPIAISLSRSLDEIYLYVYLHIYMQGTQIFPRTNQCCCSLTRIYHSPVFHDRRSSKGYGDVRRFLETSSGPPHHPSILHLRNECVLPLIPSQPPCPPGRVFPAPADSLQELRRYFPVHLPCGSHKVGRLRCKALTVTLLFGRYRRVTKKSVVRKTNIACTPHERGRLAMGTRHEPVDEP